MKRLSIALVGAGVLLSPVGASAQQFVTSAELPPNPQAGECYARVHIPSTTRAISKRVLMKEASDELVVRPAEYRWTKRQVEVVAESERLELIPARFETQRRPVIIEPERVEIEIVPAKYDTVTERVLVREAYQAWKPGTGPIQRFDHATGEIMCLVTVPAEYKEVKRRVITTPASEARKVVPAKTKMIDVKVMVEPPRFRKIKVPAETTEIRVKEEVRPMRIERRAIPAEYRTVTEQVSDAVGGVEWRPILCETNSRPDLIKEVQRALSREGFSPGDIDGLLGPATRRAVDRYQRANGLARDFLTIETMDALGVDPRG